MDDTRGKSRVIKDALIAELELVEHKGEPAFTKVTGSTDDEFEGYPAVRLLPGNLENKTGTSASKDRTVNYNALVHIEVESTEHGQETAIDYMYDLTDAMVDRLDEADFHNRLEAHEPGVGTFMLSGDLVDWDFVSQNAGTMLLFVVRISVSYSKHLGW